MSILVRLASIANELDSQGLTEEADAVDQVFQKLSQSLINQRVQKAPQPNMWNALQGIGQGLWGATEAGVAASPLGQGMAAYNQGANLVNQGIQSVNNSFDSAVDARVKQQNPQPAANNSVTQQQTVSALQQSSYDYEKQVKPYLGWAYNALVKPDVAVGNTRPRTQERLNYVRNALIQHLRARNQSPAFEAHVLQEFDTRLGNQQVFQAQQTQGKPLPGARIQA